MNPLRAEAFKLRIKGKSYNEIHAALGIPKSTLSGWFNGLILSENAQTRLRTRVQRGTEKAFVARNKFQTVAAEKRARITQATSKKEIGTLKGKDLLLVGTILYWAEGYKRLKVRDGKERMGHPISFVNSDPEMVRVFMRFLRESMKISDPDIKVSMRLYKHIGEAEALKYWMNITKLSRKNFLKTTYLVSGASKGIRPYNRLPQGTVQVQVCNTEKFHHLLGWIEGVKAKL